MTTFEQQYEEHFDKLVRVSEAVLRGVGEKADAENIVQDVFTYCLQKRTTYNYGFYLVAVTNNSIRFRIRKLARFKSFSSGEDLGDDEPTTSIEIEPKSVRELIDEYLYDRTEIKRRFDKLPNQNKKIIELILEGYTYDEIAKQFDMNPGTLGSTISRLRKTFRRTRNE